MFSPLPGEDAFLLTHLFFYLSWSRVIYIREDWGEKEVAKKECRAQQCQETSIHAWHGKAATSLVKSTCSRQHFLTTVEPKIANNNTSTPPPWDLLKHCCFVSLALASEFRAPSDRLKRAACRPQVPASASQCGSLPLREPGQGGTSQLSCRVWLPRLGFLGADKRF